jgi:hypothetical protein
MRSHGLAWPDRADLSGRVVADRKHEIERFGSGAGELVPTFRSKVLGRIVLPLQELERVGVYFAFRKASRTEALEFSVTKSIQDGLRENAASGVARTQKKDVVRLVGHISPVASSPRCHLAFFEHGPIGLQSLHALLLLLVARLGSAIAGWQSAEHDPPPAVQQLSVKYATREFIAAKSAA